MSQRNMPPRFSHVKKIVMPKKGTEKGGQEMLGVIMLSGAEGMWVSPLTKSPSTPLASPTSLYTSNNGQFLHYGTQQIPILSINYYYYFPAPGGGLHFDL